MKILWIISLLFISINTEASTILDSNELYVCHHFDKRPGLEYVRFHSIESSGAIKCTSFSIYYRKRKLKIHHIGVSSYTWAYDKSITNDDSGNIVVTGTGIDISWKLLTSKAFHNEGLKLDKRGRCSLCSFYYMLHPRFLEMTNEEKLKLLIDLGKRYEGEVE